jgi:hypothetical protein
MIRRVAALLAALLLTGCFDLDQKIAFNRDGSGSYEVAVTAEGVIGEALKKERLISDTKQPVHSETEVSNGKIIHRESISFAQLSDLNLPDEDIALTVRGRDFFGLGPTHVAFTRTVHSNDVEKSHTHDKDVDTGAALAMFFGNHTYTFSVTLPGSIEGIAPLKIGGMIVEPEVTGDFYHGHTITWRMPMHLMFAQPAVTFAVDFYALGSFADSRSRGKRSTSQHEGGDSD